MYKLAIIPSDPLAAYEGKGISAKLEGYYNPLGFFEKVYLLSPLETEERIQYGLHILHVKDVDLSVKLKELGVDIVRAYGGYWPCDMACNFRVDNVPVVVSVHDRRSEWLHKTIKNADIVFAVSEEVKALVASKGKDPQQIWLLPNRVDFDLMQSLPEDRLKGLSAKYKYKYKILHLGRKSEEKNLDKIIRALKLLGSEYGLIAIGRGDESEYEDIAQSEGVLDRVHFIQNVKNEELPVYFSFADCLCNPSSTEAMSSALVEAMACGTVVVTSTMAARGVGMIDGKDALVFAEYNDPVKISEKIRAVCENDELRNKLKNGARKSVKKYDKRTIDLIEVEYYKKILEMNAQGEFSKSFMIKLVHSSEVWFYRILKKIGITESRKNG